MAEGFEKSPEGFEEEVYKLVREYKRENIHAFERKYSFGVDDLKTTYSSIVQAVCCYLVGEKGRGRDLVGLVSLVAGFVYKSLTGDADAAKVAAYLTLYIYNNGIEPACSDVLRQGKCK